MKVLFVNPIIYTPENAHIPQIDSIDDTMSYDLCMAFQRHGVDITLLRPKNGSLGRNATSLFRFYG